MDKNALMETTCSQEEIFRGRIFDVHRDQVRLPDGRQSVREVVHHKTGGVCVVPLTEDGKVYVVRQCRYPYQDVLTEIPAGKLDPGETPEECGRRELLEEAGAVAGKMTSLGQLFPTPAYVDEVIYMYLAEDLTYARQKLDDGEFLEAEAVPLKRLVEEILAGNIRDGKTQAALLKAWLLLERRK
ncbi:MAG: NUDIX domain-containing protein [Candidatus Merdivicinus sp.]|jgi:ADP-ribose pyrophosphatase